jgi:hypothetical protein
VPQDDNNGKTGVVLVTVISNDKIPEIMEGRGKFSLVILGCSVWHRTYMTFQKFTAICR